MSKQSLKIGWILMLILGIYRGAMSVYLLATKFMDLQNTLVFFSNAIAIILISLTSYKKGEKWSWYCLLLIGALPLVAGALWNATHPSVIVGWIIFLLGLLIPIKVFFKK